MVVRGRAAVVGLVALATLIGGACGSDSTSSGATSAATAASTPTTASTTMSTTPSDASEPTRTFTTAAPPATGTVEAGLESAVALAVADLAEQTGTAADDVTVVSARNVTWPNGANGCPQPGMNYTQVMVDGAEIILAAGGMTYRYTLGGSSGPKLCTT